VETLAMPYALPAGKPDASAMAKPYILNTSMDSPEASLLIKDLMATLFLDPSPTSNYLKPVSYPLPHQSYKNFSNHYYESQESKYPLPRIHLLIMYHPMDVHKFLSLVP